MSQLITGRTGTSKPWYLLLCLLLGLLPAQPGCAQELLPAQAAELDFAHYLLQHKQYADGRDVLRALPRQPRPLRDTVAFLTGYTFYQQQQLDSAALYLGQVSAASRQFVRARFLSAISLAYRQQYAEARQQLQPLQLSEPSVLAEARVHEQAGLALLQHRYAAFDSLKKQFTGQYYQLAEHEENLQQHALRLQQVKRKSPVLGGVLSAVLPGSGKVYAGKLGGGITAFLANGILAAQTYEGYRKGGVKDPEFILFGSLFSLFYIGNIWGSALAVRISRQEHYQTLHEQILLDMHIPVRVLFH